MAFNPFLASTSIAAAVCAAVNFVVRPRSFAKSRSFSNSTAVGRNTARICAMPRSKLPAARRMPNPISAIGAVTLSAIWRPKARIFLPTRFSLACAAPSPLVKLAESRPRTTRRAPIVALAIIDPSGRMQQPTPARSRASGQLIAAWAGRGLEEFSDAAFS